MEKNQRPAIDQILRKVAKIAGSSDIFTQDYSVNFRDIKILNISTGKIRPSKYLSDHILSFLG